MGLTEVLIAGFGMSLSIVFYFLSAILDGTWWNFLVLIPLFLMAIPMLFCFADSQNYSENDGWLNAGQFLSGFLAVSIFAIPLMNFHLGAIVTRQLAFGLAGNVCAIGAIVGYYGWQAYKSDSIGGFM
ncbi:Vacuolar protein sorting 55 [Plasmodiophora brassicae]|uniref:Vacuolar protein sorting 55 n=1 Tax=Plasmodiophora brassicae TaxID=37360 RepID=A0A0G4IYE2_PLABS|nr:hypothetical protein PBRA_007996 [Plasmodiophora brassicae]SPQ96522.1 unnamed protein product [Plasmodiophora brassicae]